MQTQFTGDFEIQSFYHKEAVVIFNQRKKGRIFSGTDIALFSCCLFKT